MKKYKFALKKRFYDFINNEIWEPETFEYDENFLMFSVRTANVHNETAFDINQARMLADIMPEYFELEEIKPRLKRQELYEKYHTCHLNWGLWGSTWSVDDYERCDNDCYNSYNYFPIEAQAEEALEDIFKVYPYPQWQEKLIEFHDKKGNLE